MTPLKHAESTARKWGGVWQDYVEIHNWFDATKTFTGDWTHRALRHSSFGVELAIERFGHVIMNSNGQSIPTKVLAEMHIQEDVGFIPTVQDWLKPLKNHPEPWMLKVKTKSVSIDTVSFQ